MSITFDALGIMVFMVSPTAVELSVVMGLDQVVDDPCPQELYGGGWPLCSHKKCNMLGFGSGCHDVFLG